MTRANRFADKYLQKPADAFVWLLFLRLDRRLARIRNDAPHID